VRFSSALTLRQNQRQSANIEIAISRTGSLLKQKQSKVSVVSLPGPEKGVDDLIAAIGPASLRAATSSSAAVAGVAH
jgi:hypothetical protein